MIIFKPDVYDNWERERHKINGCKFLKIIQNINQQRVFLVFGTLIATFQFDLFVIECKN